MAAGNIDAVVAQAKIDRKRLDSAAIGPFSLTAIGIASVVGAGIFVTIGEASAQYAGPAVIFSFILAGLAAGVTALCYAELAAMVPAAGSTYSYAYAVFGSFLAWFIGWDLLLEYLFAASTVAVGWSGYFVSFLGSIGVSVPHDLVNPPFGDDTGILNLPALAIVFATCGAAVPRHPRVDPGEQRDGGPEARRARCCSSASAPSTSTSANWEPFVPTNQGGFGDFGVTGILRAAGVVFFAYVGFDAVSTAAAEARRPQRTIPIGLLATVLISTVLYVVIGIVMTGMVPFKSLNVADPLALAVREGGGSLDWLESMVSAAAVIGLAATVLVTFYGQTRIFMRMSSDGMLPDRLGRVSKRFETPTAATVVCAIAGAAVAALLPIDILGDLVSIGTLLSFTIVCAGVLVLRRARPDLERPFRVKFVWLVAPLGIVFAIALMATLPITTWIRLGVWLLIGLVIYFSYARGRTNERMNRLRDAEPYVEPVT